MSFRKELSEYVEARTPGLWVSTYEEPLVLPEIKEVGKSLNIPVLFWSSIRGLSELSRAQNIVPPDAKLIGALQHLEQQDGAYLLVLADPSESLKSADALRQLREMLMHEAEKIRTVVVVTPKTEIPLELVRHMQPLTFRLPDLEELTPIVSGVAKEQALRLTKAAQIELAESAASMTVHEAKVAVRRALKQHGNDIHEAADLVWNMKSELWQQTGLIITRRATESWEDVGGAYELKKHFEQLLPSFSAKARSDGIPTSRGMLLVGPPGTGKSLVSRVIAAKLGWRYLDWDLGRLLGPYVGTSEENTRRLLEISDLHRPCVVRIDEISHQFSGFESSGYTDSGVVSRMISRILTWLEERSDGLYMVASTNEPSQLPPNLVRSGRFGSTWFLDLPNHDGLAAILAIHAKKHCSELWSLLEPHLPELTRTMKEAEFSGADVEQTIVESIQLAYPEQPTYKLFKETLLAQVPTAATMREQIERMRKWAKGRARVA